MRKAPVNSLYFDLLHSRLQFVYNCDCETCSGGVQLAANKKELNQLLNAVEKAYKQLQKKGEYHPDDLVKEKAYKNLIDQTNNLIQKSVAAGIKEVIPAGMKKSLQNDVFIFSALKTHAQLYEASRMLTNDDGSVRTFFEFQQAVAGIKENYNVNYLDAERNFALSSAQQASNWAAIEADDYYLQYRTAMDEKVRALHLSMEGTTLPPSDPFWSMYYPPNGWRCRCTAPQVSKSKYDATDSDKAIAAGEAATTKISATGQNKLEIFRFNPGKQKVIFPPGHPYNKINGAGIVKEIVKSEILAFILKEDSKNNGKIFIHELVDPKASDFKRLLDIARQFANKGNVVELLPRFNSTLKNERYLEIFKDLETTPYWGKCPDLRIDGQFYEHEGFTSDNPKNAFKNMLNRGLKQSDKIIIDKCGVTDDYVKRTLIQRIKKGQTIEEIWEFDGTKIRMIFKKAKVK